MEDHGVHVISQIMVTGSCATTRTVQYSGSTLTTFACDSLPKGNSIVHHALSCQNLIKQNSRSLIYVLYPHQRLRWIFMKNIMIRVKFESLHCVCIPGGFTKALKIIHSGNRI